MRKQSITGTLLTVTDIIDRRQFINSLIHSLIHAIWSKTFLYVACHSGLELRCSFNDGLKRVF